MTDTGAARHKTTFRVLAAFIILWGFFGALDVADVPYSGYGTDGDNNVIRVAADGPAQAAGLRVGDRIRSVGGVDVEDTKALVRQPRAKLGEVRTVVVERGGETVEAVLQYAQPPTSQKVSAHLAGLIGLAFLLFGLWAYGSAPGKRTTLLASLGVLFGFAFVGAPYIASATLSALVGALTIFAVILGFAVLLHFVLTFPEEGAEHNTRAIYLPAVIVGAVPALFLLLQPDATSGVNLFFRLLFGLFLLGYLGLAIIGIIRKVSAATARQRTADGLNLLLLGTIVGLAPLLVGGLTGLVSPSTVLPGQQYYFLSVGIIPITFALAALRSAENAVPEMAYATEAAPAREAAPTWEPPAAEPAEREPPGME